MLPVIEKLLILQDRDNRRLAIEGQLARIPVETAELAHKIQEERDGLAAADMELKTLEVRRNALDQDVKSREERIRKYKNQQLDVKKNEEYQALTHEIATLEEEIGRLEEDEIALMLEIDSKKEAFATEAAERQRRVALFEEGIGSLREREKTMKEGLAEAQTETASAEKEVDPAFRDRYTHIRGRGIRFPIVVPLQDHKCGGCHLRVSGEVETEVRRKTAPVSCDSCGRMLYLED